MTEELSLQTRAVAGGRPHGPGQPLNVPMVLTSTYVADGALGYAREGTPTWIALEEVLGSLEDAYALSFASGMGAINAVLDLVPSGGKVVAPTHPYSGTGARLRELNAVGRINTVLIDMDKTDAITAALDGAALLWIETPTNPMMEIADLRRLATEARKRGVRTVVDNTFATPVLQRPLDHGIDITMQSGTKYIAGHSDALLGVLATKDGELRDQLKMRRSIMGLNPGAMETWLALRGVRTLVLRLRQATENAALIAERLASTSGISKVLYPGLSSHPQHELAMSQMANGGAIVCFVLDGTADDAERVCNATSLWTHATSLGGVESTLERRARWSLESADVPASLIRLSVGIEDVEDLWRDLKHALSA